MLIYGAIAMVTPVALILARGWLRNGVRPPVAGTTTTGGG